MVLMVEKSDGVKEEIPVRGGCRRSAARLARRRAAARLARRPAAARLAWARLPRTYAPALAKATTCTCCAETCLLPELEQQQLPWWHAPSRPSPPDLEQHNSPGSRGPRPWRPRLPGGRETSATIGAARRMASWQRTSRSKPGYGVLDACFQSDEHMETGDENHRVRNIGTGYFLLTKVASESHM